MGGRLMRDIVATIFEEKEKDLPPPSPKFPHVTVINPSTLKNRPDEEKKATPVESLGLTSAEIKALRVSERVLLAVHENDEASVDMISKKTKINVSSIYRAIRENRHWFVTRPSTKGRAWMLYSLSASGRARANTIHRYITTKRKKACPPTPKPSSEPATSGT